MTVLRTALALNSLLLSMILSENRYPLCGIMLFGDQSVTFTIIFMRGWMAHSTCTSPGSLKVTSVAAPGACEPRLNSLPLLVERMLCGMVSSLTKVSDSPFLMVTFSAENTLPFWWISLLAAASAPTEKPATMARAMGISLRIFEILFCVD